MSIHISYACKEMPFDLRASQQAKDSLAQGTQYSLLLKNESAQPWTFYVYQKQPQQVADVLSLAWFCSPYQTRVDDQIRFTWEIDYNFVWSDTGQLIPGVDFVASGAKDCSPAGKNTTEFSLTPDLVLAPRSKGPPPVFWLSTMPPMS